MHFFILDNLGKIQLISFCFPGPTLSASSCKDRSNGCFKNASMGISKYNDEIGTSVKYYVKKI